MLTSDPIYKKPLVPRITVKNTANTSTLYTYDPWTDAGTSGKPIYCMVQLSQNTHGQFVFELEAQGYSTPFSIGDRVIIECGKQSTQMTRLISGLIRRRGTLRGADNRVIQHFEGSSTGIRLNERVIYAVNEAAKLAQDGITIDLTDATRKADTLLATTLNSVLTSDGIISATSLATNSDVETFIPSLSIEYGELQDVVNYIEDQSGGEVVVDVNDIVNFRGEIRGPVGGRGFTIKNKPTSISGTVDDADDTMYLRGKNWSWMDSVYKSDSYANRLYSILPAESEPVDDGGSLGNLGGIRTDQFSIAQKFRPTHSHWLLGDLFIAGAAHGNTANAKNISPAVSICQDSGGLPLNTNGVIATYQFNEGAWSLPANTVSDTSAMSNGMAYIVSPSLTHINSFDLDTTKDYWLLMKLSGLGNSLSVGFDWFTWNYRSTTTGVIAKKSGANVTDYVNGGTGWTTATGLMWFAMPRRRSHSFVMWDPKAMKAVQTGLLSGLATDSVLSDLSAQIKTKEALYRHLPQQLYSLARPRANYEMATVMAPNVPPFPGDPIVISDTVLGLTQSGQRATITTCGDMTYSWGSPGGQGMTYQAPTILNISPVGIPTRYR